MSGSQNSAGIATKKPFLPRKQGEEEGEVKKWYRRLKGVFWAFCGLAVIQKVELIRVVLDEPAVDRLVFGSGVAAWLAFAAIGFYLTQLAGLKNEHQWKAHYPNAIPIAAACGVIGFFLIVC